MNYIGHVRWEAYESGDWTPYCLIGEADQYGNCPGSLYMEAQPLTCYLPLILKEF